jgi:hypothetical protein
MMPDGEIDQNDNFSADPALFFPPLLSSSFCLASILIDR